jgi:hypothetical protein
MDYDLKVMKNHGPWFWNAWWWRPSDDPAAQLYTGDLGGNRYSLLYDPYSRVAYLYIQNT